jgi:hypothetical protein
VENQTVPQTYTEHTTPPNKEIQTLTKLEQGKDMFPKQNTKKIPPKTIPLQKNNTE